MPLYTDGIFTPPKLVCSGTDSEPRLSFEGGFGDGVKVVMEGAGEALMSREEIAALAALFPVSTRRDPKPTPFPPAACPR